VEKYHFLSLVKNYTSITSEELTDLQAIQIEFPYSQVIHNLVSRAAADNHSPANAELLSISAIYTTERAALKFIITGAKKQHTDFAAKPTESLAREVVWDLNTPSPTHTDFDADALIENLYSDLEKLKKSKATYEAYEASLETLTKEQFTHPLVEREHSHLDLIEELESEEYNTIADPKQKEQIKIIENFIKTQPTLQKPKAEAQVEPTDLSGGSQHFADNVISETLVEILLKQGKKAKAIEVLKKLIWKFPQKKAYFASQIEDLKK
jgi:tetratricopeptide (TPR) repeat protein